MAAHMTPDEFRAYGHQVVDWVADYWATLEQRPVLPSDPPGTVAGKLPARAPVAGEGVDAILKDLDEVVLPGVTHWQHPGFFAYFPANTSGPSVLGDLVSSGLGVQGMLWATSPAATEVETVVLDWLVGLLGLPERFLSTGAGGGVIQDSASSATLVATLAALHRASGGEWRSAGVRRRFTAYTSTQGHSSIEKAARIAGIGDGQVRAVETDEACAMRPEALRAALAADVAAGCVPAIVVATIGTTSTTAVDPLPAIAEICREYGVWLHVDAAYAGSAAVCPELRWSHAGVEFADSYCFDPHKWLLTGFDCDAFWVADRAELVQALTVLPEYLRNAASDSGAVLDYRDWQVPLGRRFRALKLWFVLRWYGEEGLRAHIRSGVAAAQWFAERVRADERFEVVAPHPFSLVCFRLRSDDGDGADEQNAALLARANASGAAYLTHTRVHGRYALRLAVGSPRTEERHVAAAWELIAGLAGEPG
ncbi:pyridoxal-dependent decarboxylase [Spirilliplanes yamanashiensis]|uniref:Aromatic-L-amino-acid decarboxylase n=1 Tax=Spirilliplanes yamanashiensis TaxID=42233 RepID=A0A8J4DIQ2_9ACTN|nr:pyridoxal-dependent decarboxylase [Spirilliplanes yamanashiensis]MDP9817032.1 aromatic-L-amino-acid decarboxylase [Spirilliplanes yamanashiensis]GIJ03312.1 aromatic-L-amino-acid decarboxylase [Spirilliplanes yamanashiensis]